MASVKSNQANSTQSRADKTKLAINPAANIAVFASAGSGKTHLLVHRILKLLLSGIEPSQILAITFTRKAAAEMQERLMKVLAEWATADDKQVKITLQSLSHPNDDASIAKARKLYEELLFAEYEIRITTFHAFCQDILKRFAIHAGVPAGFNVTENNHELKQQARKYLFKQAKHEKNQNLSEAIFTLLKHSSTVNNVNDLLDTFIDARSDWRSFTEHQSNPVEYADNCLCKLLFPKQAEISKDLDQLTPLLKEYLMCLSEHKTKTNLANCALLSAYLEAAQPKRANLEHIVSVFFKTNMVKREIKATKTLEKSLGEKTQTFISLHDTLCEQIENYIDTLKKEDLIEFNHAWFFAGQKLLEEYQNLKFSQHTLDFDDLEWYTYLLLNQNDSAAWIQYKLDQRIQHILVDEFQDTNPTQWYLILPLLNELALDSHENHRSLFLVGDSKQSIYGFRRANPKLQLTAAEWAKENLSAQLIETDDSYRSSPAIIEFVNKIFSQPEIELSNFNLHHAVQSELWGKIQINQLVSSAEIKPEDDKHETPAFRNPLAEAKQNFENDSHYIEGQFVATSISELISNATPIMDNQIPRPVEYGDVIILARNRTHLAQIEQALSEKQIPYNSSNDGNFFEQLEVQDMVCLLSYLIQSHNDLALAQVLRSPLYAMSDQDLMEISCQSENTWHEKLQSYSESSNNLLAKQAFEQLQSFRKLSNTLPVHDLLDRIYFETNLLERYKSSLPDENTSGQTTHVLANLTTLLQLSLDLDAGRYSSIQAFLTALQNLQPGDTASYAQMHQNSNAVQIMSVHSAKGLEAPVVFLVDTGPRKKPINTYKSLINWPSQARRPEQFFIAGRKDSVDKVTQAIIDQQNVSRRNEELNLLYVALTRAKQYLYISGCESKQAADKSWHAIISEALDEDFQTNESEVCSFDFGTAPPIKSKQTAEPECKISNNYDLSKPFPKPEPDQNELQSSEPENQELADYGTLVHKIFELSEHKQEYLHNKDTLKLAIESSLAIKLKTKEFENAANEVSNCLATPELKSLFETKDNQEILKEVPISFVKNKIVLHRIIDHLIINDKQAWIIDYKTARNLSADTLQEHAMQYQAQMNTYGKLYPDKKIRASILFTSIATLVDLEVETKT